MVITTISQKNATDYVDEDYFLHVRFSPTANAHYLEGNSI